MCSSRWVWLVDAEVKDFCDQMYRILKKRARKDDSKDHGPPAATHCDVAAGLNKKHS